MEYRPLGRTGMRVSAVGLGTEYLLNKPREHVAAVVRAAIERGVNYADVFWAQPEFRDNMGAALAEGYRDRIHLAAHLGATWTNGQGDRTRDPALALRFFHDFLTRYRTDYVDVLHVHNVDEPADFDRAMGPGGLLDLARRLKQEGKARAIGFSGHTVATATRAVETGAVEVLMFPVNLAGHAVPGRREFFQLCAERGVGLVAMKPYAGGKLLQAEHTMVLASWQVGGADKRIERKVRITPVQCLAYVLSQPGISTIVPGCQSLEHLADAQAVWTATSEEKDFAPVLADFAQYVAGECVYCNHCLPCPSGLDVGQTIRLLELARGKPDAALRLAYAALPAPAADCIQCGDCAARCPFGVDSVAKIEQAAILFTG